MSVYEYTSREAGADVLNVGWLSGEHPFNRATPDEAFVEALRRLVGRPINVCRGFHLCEFCPAPPSNVSPDGTSLLDPGPDTTGTGEIRVVGNGGIRYAAPVLILHYVTEHQYAPPKPFIEAVLRAG